MTKEQLFSIRKARGLTQTELGNQLGTSAQNVSRWEKGEHEVPGWVEEKLYRAIKVALSIEDLSRLACVAIKRETPLDRILGEAIRLYLDEENPPEDLKYPKNGNEPNQRAAEDPPE